MGVENSMGLFPNHTAPSQGPAGTGAYKKTVKKGYAGYGDIINPAASTPSFDGEPGNPLYQKKTAAEVMAYRNQSGIAPTAQNMGSLAVQYRADAATAREGGGQSVGDKRAQKVIDKRRIDETKRLKDRSAAELAFKKRSKESKEKWGASTPSPDRGIHTNSTKLPGPRQSDRGLGSAKAPKADVRSNSPYGLF